jgi:hypothetical protein
MSALQKNLTANYLSEGMVKPVSVPLWRKHGDYTAIPRTYAAKELPELYAIARRRLTQIRRSKVLFPDRIQPRNEQQRKFMAELTTVCLSDNVIDVQAVASTGAGKTVSSLKAIASSGIYPVLIIVPTNRLKEQWLGDVSKGWGMRTFYGEDWVKKYVGIAQQERCDFTGKLIVVGMAPSIASRDYGEAFYRNFAAIFLDEVDVFATPVLHNVLHPFSAPIRIGLTATPRKGAMAKVTTAHIGEPVIRSTQQVMQPLVFKLRYSRRADWLGSNGTPIESKNLLINFVTRLKERQSLLTALIYYRGYCRKRHCLVLSDRTDQLLDFKDRLVNEYGVPDNVIGVYVGQHKTDKWKLTGYIDDGKLHHLRGLPPFDSKKEAQKYADSIPGTQFIKITRYRHKPTDADYDNIEKNLPIVLATYGIFGRGNDISRLDWALEASPRGEVTQPTGRILRILEGKPTPEWYSITDDLFTDITKTMFGKSVTERYRFKTFSGLADGRQRSYANQRAIIKEMGDLRAAIEKAKAAIEISAKEDR